MTMVKKSITVTDQQNDWIKTRVASGQYGNESEVLRELIREKQIQELETPAEIKAIRAKLIEGEKSGFTNKSRVEILAGFKGSLRDNGRL